MDEVEGSTEISSTSACMMTSVVWDNFLKLPLDINPDNRLRAKFKDCGRVYLTDLIAGTSNLKRHRAKRHNNVSESGRYPAANIEMFHELIAKAIVRHNLHFSFVEYEGIREIHTF